MKARTILMEGQARAIEASAEAWKKEAEQAQAVAVLEQILAAAMFLADLPAQLVGESWQQFRASPRTFPAQQVGEGLAGALAPVLKALDGMDGCIRLAEDAGYHLESAADFRIAHRRVRDLEQWLHEGWPILDVEEARAAQARIDAGQYATLEDLTRAVDVAD